MLDFFEAVGPFVLLIVIGLLIYVGVVKVLSGQSIFDGAKISRAVHLIAGASALALCGGFALFVWLQTSVVVRILAVNGTDGRIRVECDGQTVCETETYCDEKIRRLCDKVEVFSGQEVRLEATIDEGGTWILNAGSGFWVSWEEKSYRMEEATVRYDGKDRFGNPQEPERIEVEVEAGVGFEGAYHVTDQILKDELFINTPAPERRTLKEGWSAWEIQWKSVQETPPDFGEKNFAVHTNRAYEQRERARKALIDINRSLSE